MQEKPEKFSASIRVLNAIAKIAFIIVTIIASQDDVNKKLGKDFVEEHKSRKQVIVSFIWQATTTARNNLGAGVGLTAHERLFCECGINGIILS